jgi:hypothetical protein
VNQYAIPLMKTIIAHYNSDKIWRHILIILAVICVPVFITLIVLQKSSFSDLLHSADAIYVIPVLAMIWGFSGWLALVVFVVLKQILFKRGEAIWVEDGVLVYLSRFAFDVPLKAIRGISFNSSGRVMLDMMDGRAKQVPTRSLQESSVEVGQRLKAIFEKH